MREREKKEKERELLIWIVGNNFIIVLSFFLVIYLFGLKLFCII